MMRTFLQQIDSAIESDCRYFEMAAEKRDLATARFVWMTGLTGLPSASVAQRVVMSADPSSVVPDLEREARLRGVSLVRIYLTESDSRWMDYVRCRGYVVRRELVQLAGPPVFEKWTAYGPLELQWIDSPKGWAQRRQLLADNGFAPDHHQVNADSFIEMEQRKSAGGDLSFVLARDEDGTLVGSVGLMRVDGVLRLKNLIVSPDLRNRGFASRMVAQISRLPEFAGLTIASFEVENRLRPSLYQRMGFGTAFTYLECSQSHDEA